MPAKPQGPSSAWPIKAFAAVHVALYRLSGGAIGGRLGKGPPIALLHVRGRRSGKPITTPLNYVRTDRGYALIASFGGSPRHPAWYLNLAAAGAAELEIGRRRIAVRVEQPAIDSERYKAIWRDAVTAYPDYEAYQARTSRRIPVVELVPQ